MQELVGRLTALDPEASASLTVISYFDALLANGAGLESLVRAAAVLGGVPAGARDARRTTRIDATGRRDGSAPRDADTGWPSSANGGGPTVWIERVGPPHANDAMILDRLALAAAVVDSRRSGDAGAVELALDPDRAPDARARALRALAVDPTRPLRVLSLGGSVPDPGLGPTALIATNRGVLRAVLTTMDVVAVRGTGPDGVVGCSSATAPDALPAAWRDARLCRRLADARHPVVDATELGALLPLVAAAEPAAREHPDVVVLAELSPDALASLDELAEAESVRAAAAALGLHHSTLQARHQHWTAELGYDPRAGAGRLRYAAARLLLRLAE